MRYRGEIDGLRALAVVPVIFFHAGLDIFKGGFVGVDVFFVISGYLITTIILNEKEAGSFSIVKFYERRARRILPALFFVVIATIPFAWVWLLPADMKEYALSISAVATFVSNIFFGKESGYFSIAAELKPLLHTWSLAVEEQYYIFFPLFVMAAWKYGKQKMALMLAIIALLSLGYAEWAAVYDPETAFYILPTRAWELLIGVLIAFYFVEKPNLKSNDLLGFLGVALIVYAIITFDRNTPFPSLYTLVPTVGAALIILFASGKSLVARAMGNRVFVGIGLISYSAYLWHQPLFAFARHKTANEPSQELLYGLIIASLVLAYLTWRFVEQPFRDKQRFSAKQIFKLSGYTGGALVAFGLIISLSDGYAGRMNDNVELLLSAAKDRNPRNSECHFGPFSKGRIENACILGDENNLKGALVGDSHADAISHELEMWAQANNIGIKSLTVGSCPPAVGVQQYLNGSPSQCAQQNLAINEYLLANDAIEFIVTSSRLTAYLAGKGFDNEEGGHEKGAASAVLRPWPQDTSLQAEGSDDRAFLGILFKRTMQSYLDAGKKLILIYPVPEAGWNVPRKMASQAFLGTDAGKTFDTSYELFKTRNKHAHKVLDDLGDHPNIIRISPEGIFCDTVVQGRCVVDIGGHPLYADDDHLNNFGAKFIIDEVVKELEN